MIAKALLLATLVLGSTALIKAQLPPGWGNPRLRACHAAWRAEAERTPVVFIGSSRFYSGLAPAHFDARAGTRSRSISAPGCFNPERYVMAEAVLAEAPPGLDTLIIELDLMIGTVDDNNHHTPQNLYWRQPVWTERAIATIREAPVPHHSLPRELQLLIESTPAAGLGPMALESALLAPRQGFAGPRGDGYWALEHELEATGNPELERRARKHREDPDVVWRLRAEAERAFAERGRQPLPVSATHLAYLEGLIARAAARGVHLILVLPPRVAPVDRILALHDKLPREHRVELADPRRYPQFYDPRRSFDGGHLDAPTSAVFSVALADAVLRLRRR